MVIRRTRGRLALGILILCGGLIAAVLLTTSGGPRPVDVSTPGTQETGAHGSVARLPDAPPANSPGHGTDGVEDAGPERRFPRRWNKIVRAALDDQIERAGRGSDIDDAERDALMAVLADVRAASRALQHLSSEEERERRSEYLQAIIEGDRTFREAVGVGVSEFIAAQSAGTQIVDLAPEQP